MKPPQEGGNTGAPSLRGLQGRSATGLNGQAAKDELSAVWRGGWMPENTSGVPAGRSVFHLTSPLIGLLALNRFWVLHCVLYVARATLLCCNSNIEVPMSEILEAFFRRRAVKAFEPVEIPQVQIGRAHV